MPKVNNNPPKRMMGIGNAKFANQKSYSWGIYEFYKLPHSISGS
jgi:hypothetical protein